MFAGTKTAMALWLCLACPAASAEAPAEAGTTVLNERHFWRKHYSFFPPRLSIKAAEAAGVELDEGARATFLARHYHSGFHSPPPAEGWRAPGFDDSAWLLERGRQFVCGDSRAMEYTKPDATNPYLRGTDPFVEEVGLICQRGKFLAADRSKVRRLLLSLTYRGGFVAYLNGKEVARASLPAGEVTPRTAADDYPLEAFFLTGGGKTNQPLHWFTHRQSTQWPLRERTFGPAEIDRGALRDGLNVLSIEFHRTDYPAECNRKTDWRTQPSLYWATLGMSLMSLGAEADDGAVRAAPARRTRLEVWPVDITAAVSDRTCRNHDEPLGPVRIAAARNGTFAGQVIVAGQEALEGVSAAAGELVHAAGKARIPAASVHVAYGAANPAWKGGLGYHSTILPHDMKMDTLGSRFDALLEAPPAGVSAMPIWAMVKVPPDAPAGRYAGTLTIKVQAAQPVRVPVELHVSDWTLPDVKDYASLINIYQSPDTLVSYYKLQPWSGRHWAMIERSLKLMGEIGNIGLFVPLLAESQFGNTESMVVWIKQPDGTYRYDFAVFDRYLQTALKYHARLKFIALVVWGYECHRRKDNPPAGAMVTVRNPATGETANMKLPEYGTEEAERLWRPLLSAVRQRLAKQGLGELILLGLPADGAPHWSHVAMFRRILPQARWIRESHFNANGYRYDPKDKRALVPVAYNSIVWGGAVPDPKVKRLYGWRLNPNHLVMTFNRAGASALNLHGFPPPWSYRIWMESTLAGGRNGNGRVGGDYWRIGMRPRGPGRISSEAGGGCGGTLFGSYLKSGVGQVGLGNSTTDLFAPGAEGPVRTVRFQNALEGNQEAEARIFIERVLLDKDTPLPAELAERCRGLLDERTNALRMWAIGAADIARYRWQERTGRLYDAAAAVREALRSAAATRPAGKPE